MDRINVGRRGTNKTNERTNERTSEQTPRMTRRMTHHFRSSRQIRAEASTFGVYTCRARNSVGSTDFHLELVDAAAIVQAQTPTALIGAIAAAIIVCIILLLISESRNAIVVSTMLQRGLVGA